MEDKYTYYCATTCKSTTFKMLRNKILYFYCNYKYTKFNAKLIARRASARQNRPE